VNKKVKLLNLWFYSTCWCL